MRHRIVETYDAVGYGIFAVQSEMDEARIGHRDILLCSGARTELPATETPRLVRICNNGQRYGDQGVEVTSRDNHEMKEHS